MVASAATSSGARTGTARLLEEKRLRRVRLRLQVIVGNSTAFVVYASPNSTCPGDVALRGTSMAQGASLDVWTLTSANNA